MSNIVHEIIIKLKLCLNDKKKSFLNVEENEQQNKIIQKVSRFVKLID